MAAAPTRRAAATMAGRRPPVVISPAKSRSERFDFPRLPALGPADARAPPAVPCPPKQSSGAAPTRGGASSSRGPLHAHPPVRHARTRHRGRRTPPYDTRQPRVLCPLRRRGRRRRTRRSQPRVRGVRRERRVRRRRTPDHDGLTVIPAREAARQCLASNAAWRREAAALRDHAALSHLSPDVRQALLREAEAADRQADWWLTGAIEAS